MAQGTDLGSISGTVYIDPRHTCEESGHELPVAEAVVELLDYRGQPNDIVVTDRNGFFAFTDLAPGLYGIRHRPAPGFANGNTYLGAGGGSRFGSQIIGDIQIDRGEHVADYRFCDRPSSAGALVEGATQPSDDRILAHDAVFSGVENVRELVARMWTASVSQPTAAIRNVSPGNPTPLPSNGVRPIAIETVLTARAEFVYGGASRDLLHAWQLAIIDANMIPSSPRNSVFHLASSKTVDGGLARPLPAEGTWTLVTSSDEHLTPSLSRQFGMHGAVPIVGDWNGDGDTDLGLYVAGDWFLDVNGNGYWDEGDLWFQLGSDEHIPVAGDWNGDGRTDVGIVGPAVRSAAILQRFRAATPHAAPVAGDWNGDGVDGWGAYRDGQWLIDTDGDRRLTSADRTYSFGTTGDIPVVGDWNGDGVDEIGVYRDGHWLLDVNGNGVAEASDRRLRLGAYGDHPVVGDWDGDGAHEPGLFNAARTGTRAARQ